MLGLFRYDRAAPRGDRTDGPSGGCQWTSRSSRSAAARTAISASSAAKCPASTPRSSLDRGSLHHARPLEQRHLRQRKRGQRPSTSLRHGDSIRLGKSGEARLRFLIGAEESPTECPTRCRPSRRCTTCGRWRRCSRGLRAMGSAHALDEVLAVVLDLTIEFTGAERGFIMLADAAGRARVHPRPRARPGHPAGPDVRDQPPHSRGSVHDRRRRDRERPARRATCRASTWARSRSAFATSSACRCGSCATRRKSSDSSGQKRIGVLVSRQPAARHAAVGHDARRPRNARDRSANAIENARLYREEIEKLRLEQELNIAAADSAGAPARAALLRRSGSRRRRSRCPAARSAATSSITSSCRRPRVRLRAR